MSTRNKDIKHTVNQYNTFGSQCRGTGLYIIFGVVTGSYGEVCYRALGGSYKDIIRCVKQAIKLHEARKAKDIEIVHIQTKDRLDIDAIKAAYNRVRDAEIGRLMHKIYPDIKVAA